MPEIFTGATSDIFGTGVEFFAKNSADPGDYLIGEKIDINGDGSPLRHMDKPSKDGSSVDSWSSSVGSLQIWYKALTTYFTSTTNYKAARTGTLSAAAALYGSGSTEYNAVAAAWSAVNVS